MGFWLEFYLYLGLFILWFMVFSFTYYLYLTIRGHGKVLDYLLVVLVWVTVLVGTSIVTSIAFGGG